MALSYRLDHCAQQFDVASQQIITLPLQQVDREEVSSARVPGTMVIRHSGSIAEEVIRRNARWLLRPTGCSQPSALILAINSWSTASALSLPTWHVPAFSCPPPP